MATPPPPHPQAPSQAKPFSFTNHSEGKPITRAILNAALPAFNSTLKLSKLDRMYATVDGPDIDPRPFHIKALDGLGISYSVPAEQLARVPKSGPVIFVANHPFGGVEGLILPAILQQARPDLKILANFLLKNLPEMRDLFFFVDPFDRPESAKRNIASLRASIDHVKNGGSLGVFPAGAVSRLDVRKRSIIDPPWSPSIGRIIRKTKATVVPIFFEGHNSSVFQLVGLIHPLLRTMMLPRELLRKRQSHISLRIGRPIASERWLDLDNDETLVDYLRVRTYLLKEAPPPLSPALTDATQNSEDPAADTSTTPAPPPTTTSPTTPSPTTPSPTPFFPGDPIIPPVEIPLLEADITRLPDDQTLIVSGSRTVYHAHSHQIPNLLREIGRLRETAFRLVGEGTGKSIDLDEFDPYYQHLFIWDSKLKRIMGAYRMVATDTILPEKGKAGLYTSTLFKYKTKLLKQIDPALELGRSFVHPDHQRSYGTLLMLWQGVGHYVVKNPKYKHLLGAVSISTQYNSLSRQLLIAFLKINRFRPELAKLLKAKNPPRKRSEHMIGGHQPGICVGSIEEVDELLAELEADGKRMPVILKQYLKLNARFLGFNIDPDFGDVLDGLMLIDLTTVTPRVLDRYMMGKQGVKQYYKYHGIKT